MATDAPPFLLRFWWLPPALIAVGAAVAAWSFREQPIELRSFSSALLESSAQFEIGFGGPPAERVEYRASITIDVNGQQVEGTILHVARHLGGGWIRRTDAWFDTGATKSLYEERYLSHRNLLQVFRQHREKAPLIHDLMHEFGWLTDVATAQSLTQSGDLLNEDGSLLSVRQSRTAPTEPHDLIPKAAPYERIIECRRSGLVEGSTHGSVLSGPLPQVVCRIRRSDLPGEVINVFVWEPRARLFLLVNSRQPGRFGGDEVQTRRIESLSISP